jgi:hypothetical protein
MALKDAAVQRVVDQLTSLRSRLDPDERQALDALILGDTPEVVAHAAEAGAAKPRLIIAFDEEEVAYRRVMD